MSIFPWRPDHSNALDFLGMAVHNLNQAQECSGLGGGSIFVPNKDKDISTTELNDWAVKVTRMTTKVMESKPFSYDVEVEKAFLHLLFTSVAEAQASPSKRRLSLSGRFEGEDAELAEFLQPSYFKTVVQATKDVEGYDEITHLLKTPSLALKIGTSLRNCDTIRKRNGLEELDENLVKESSYFDQLCEKTGQRRFQLVLFGH
ncbi:unnamed protein product [Mytilus coruscus]|uniref:Uncharacterized protein n=1 Tax=Mytilus coruscus TaxID=42192 RepID=A0A6J8CI37_MYTCO|nr:unnamed protein product [Mytilus coruscus]